MWMTVVWLEQSVGPLVVKLELVHELALWSPFPMKEYLAQPRYGGGPWSCESPWSCDSPLRSGWRGK